MASKGQRESDRSVAEAVMEDICQDVAANGPKGFGTGREAESRRKDGTRVREVSEGVSGPSRAEGDGATTWPDEDFVLSKDERMRHLGQVGTFAPSPEAGGKGIVVSLGAKGICAQGEDKIPTRSGEKHVQNEIESVVAQVERNTSCAVGDEDSSSDGLTDTDVSLTDFLKGLRMSDMECTSPEDSMIEAPLWTVDHQTSTPNKNGLGGQNWKLTGEADSHNPPIASGGYGSDPADSPPGAFRNKSEPGGKAAQDFLADEETSAREEALLAVKERGLSASFAEFDENQAVANRRMWRYLETLDKSYVEECEQRVRQAMGEKEQRLRALRQSYNRAADASTSEDEMDYQHAFVMMNTPTQPALRRQTGSRASQDANLCHLGEEESEAGPMEGQVENFKAIYGPGFEKDGVWVPDCIEGPSKGKWVQHFSPEKSANKSLDHSERSSLDVSIELEWNKDRGVTMAEWLGDGMPNDVLVVTETKGRRSSRKDWTQIVEPRTGLRSQSKSQMWPDTDRTASQPNTPSPDERAGGPWRATPRRLAQRSASEGPYRGSISMERLEARASTSSRRVRATARVTPAQKELWAFKRLEKISDKINKARKDQGKSPVVIQTIQLPQTNGVQPKQVTSERSEDTSSTPQSTSSEELRLPEDGVSEDSSQENNEEEPSRPENNSDPARRQLRFEAAIPTVMVTDLSAPNAQAGPTQSGTAAEEGNKSPQGTQPEAITPRRWLEVPQACTGEPKLARPTTLALGGQKRERGEKQPFPWVHKPLQIAESLAIEMYASDESDAEFTTPQKGNSPPRDTALSGKSKEDQHSVDGTNNRDEVCVPAKSGRDTELISEGETCRIPDQPLAGPGIPDQPLAGPGIQPHQDNPVGECATGLAYPDADPKEGMARLCAAQEWRPYQEVEAARHELYHGMSNQLGVVMVNEAASDTVADQNEEDRLAALQASSSTRAGDDSSSPSSRRNPEHSSPPKTAKGASRKDTKILSQRSVQSDEGPSHPNMFFQVPVVPPMPFDNRSMKWSTFKMKYNTFMDSMGQTQAHAKMQTLPHYLEGTPLKLYMQLTKDPVSPVTDYDTIMKLMQEHFGSEHQFGSSQKLKQRPEQPVMDFVIQLKDAVHHDGACANATPSQKERILKELFLKNARSTLITGIIGAISVETTPFTEIVKRAQAVERHQGLGLPTSMVYHMMEEPEQDEVLALETGNQRPYQRPVRSTWKPEQPRPEGTKEEQSRFEAALDKAIARLDELLAKADKSEEERKKNKEAEASRAKELNGEGRPREPFRRGPRQYDRDGFQSSRPRLPGVCWNCNIPGHFIRDCRKPQGGGAQNNSSAQGTAPQAMVNMPQNTGALQMHQMYPQQQYACAQQPCLQPQVYYAQSPTQMTHESGQGQSSQTGATSSQTTSFQARPLVETEDGRIAYADAGHHQRHNMPVFDSDPCVAQRSNGTAEHPASDRKDVECDYVMHVAETLNLAQPTTFRFPPRGAEKPMARQSEGLYPGNKAAHAAEITKNTPQLYQEVCTRMYVDIRIAGKVTRGLIDTGAGLSLLSTSFGERFLPNEIRKAQLRIHGLEGTGVTARGKVVTPATVGRATVMATFYLVDSTGASPVIIGDRLLAALSANIYYPERFMTVAGRSVVTYSDVIRRQMGDEGYSPDLDNARASVMMNAEPEPMDQTEVPSDAVVQCTLDSSERCDQLRIVAHKNGEHARGVSSPGKGATERSASAVTAEETPECRQRRNTGKQ